MASQENPPFNKQFKEIGVTGLQWCRSLELGQAVQPCSDALVQLLSDDHPKSLRLMNVSDACEWLSVPLKQAHDRALRELQWLRERNSKSEPPRASAFVRQVGSDKDSIKLKELLNTGFAKIDKSMTLISESSIQPLGSWTRFLREATGDFDLCDMEKTQSSTTLKLGINAGHLSKMTRRIEHELRTQLNHDLRRLQEEVTKLQRRTLIELGVSESDLERFVLPKSAERDVWRSIENLIAVGKESQIEFQRRSIFDILTAGRQKVFMVIMFLSLMGRMGLPNLFASPGAKLIFGLFLGGVMISSMISSVLLWRREKTEQGEKELKKIRETLLQDAAKIVEQSERNKLAAAREYLKESLLATESTFKTWVEEATHAAKVKADAAQASKESHRKAVEERIKLTTEAERGLTKLMERVAQLANQDVITNASPTSSLITNDAKASEISNEVQALDQAASLTTSESKSALPKRTSTPLERSKPRVSGLLARREQRVSA